MKKLRKVFLKFSLKEQGVEKYEEKKAELKRLRELPAERLEYAYIYIKARYEYKKEILMLCYLLTLWSLLSFFTVLREGVHENSFVSVIFLILTVIFFLTLIHDMRNTYRIYERILLFEMVRGEKTARKKEM